MVPLLIVTLQTSDWLIQPGVAIGKVRIGADSQKATAALGKPAGGDAAMGHFWTTWVGKGGGRIDVYSTRKPGDGDPVTVDIVRITSSRFSTRGGMKTGVKSSALRSAYPNAASAGSYKSTSGKVAIWDDVAHGVAWEVGPNGRVGAMIVHRPGKPLKDENMPIAIYLGEPLAEGR